MCFLVTALGALLLSGTDASASSQGRPTGQTADGLELQLTVPTPGSVARASFPGVAGERVFVQFSAHSFGSGCKGTARVSVLAPDGTTVASKETLCATGDFLDTFPLRASGPYDVVVDPVGDLTGSVTARIFRVPPDLERYVYPEELHALGEVFSFVISVPGQNAGLEFDVIPRTRILVRVGKNTFGGGCDEAVTAWIVDPTGRLVTEKTKLCNGRQALAFTADEDGIYELVVDPPAARTGSIVVTLFLDEPDVYAEGPFAEGLYYIDGSSSYPLVVTGVYRRGIARIWVRKTGVGTIASSSRCPRRCPSVRTFRTSVDTRPLGEGRHEYEAFALGSDGRVGQSGSWRIYIDRTPPRPARNFRVESFDPPTQTAGIVWDEGPDRKLPDGTPGAGPDFYEYRVRFDDGRWSPWRHSDTPYLEIRPAPPGTVVGLRVRERDGADNVSRSVEARVRVSGSEPPPTS